MKRITVGEVGNINCIFIFDAREYDWNVGRKKRIHPECIFSFLLGAWDRQGTVPVEFGIARVKFCFLPRSIFIFLSPSMYVNAFQVYSFVT